MRSIVQLNNHDDVMVSAFNMCKSMQKNALAIKSGHCVGACILGTCDTGNALFGGFNVELSVGLGYHAEEMALINCISQYYKPKIVFVTSESEYEMQALCLKCRYLFWKVQPEIEIIIFNPDGKIKLRKFIHETCEYVESPKQRIDWDLLSKSNYI